MANLIGKIQVITCWFLVYLYNVNTYSVFKFLPLMCGGNHSSLLHPLPVLLFLFKRIITFPVPALLHSYRAIFITSWAALFQKKYRNMMKWKRRKIASAITTKRITEITHITCKPHSIDLLIFNAFLHINERKKHDITWKIHETKNSLKKPWTLIGETSSLHYFLLMTYIVI